MGTKVGVGSVLTLPSGEEVTVLEASRDKVVVHVHGRPDLGRVTVNVSQHVKIIK
jgi:hypothetical protein